ncbi:MAG: hypothetical protein AB8B55_21305 [Mariniblastus sp.]
MVFPLKVLGTVVFLVAIAATLNADDSELKYVPGKKSPSRLARQKIESGLPKGVQESVLIEPLELPQETEPLFSWFTYGDSNSRSVSVMLLTGDDDSQVRLFVDLNRDKQFSIAEELLKSNGKWRVELAAEFVNSPNRYSKQMQMVEFYVDSKTNQIALGTMGSMEGKADFDGGIRMAKYIDLNSNGTWFDPQDRIILDVNDDKKLNNLTERFSCKSMCRIGGSLYAIAGERKGNYLAFVEVVDTGSLTPQLAFEDSETKLIEVEAFLASDTGIRIPITSLEDSIECPVGIYRVETVTIKVKSKDSFYKFVFMTEGGTSSSAEVEANESGNIQLLGGLKFSAIANVIKDKRDSVLSLSPVLRSESGLYLVSSSTGTDENTDEENRLTAQSSYMGEEIGLASSGFS